MKLHEWLSDKDDFQQNLDLPVGLVEDPFNLQLMLKVKYGQSEMLKIFENMTSSEVANYINNVYNRKWEWLVTFIAEKHGVGEVNSKVINENFENLVKGSQTGSTTEQESAYNIDDFVNSGRNQNEQTSDGEQSGNRERTESYKSYFTALQQLNNIDKENIVEIMLKDIKNELCLKIY